MKRPKRQKGSDKLRWKAVMAVREGDVDRAQALLAQVRAEKSKQGR